MSNNLLGYSIICIFAAFWLCTSNASIYYNEAHQNKVCVNNSPCYDYELAHFGAVEKFTVKGLLHVAKPLNACTPVQKNLCDTDYACFLLVVEGHCSFGYKAFVAAKAGFQFVIIYNKNNNQLKKMENDKYGKLVSRLIMAVFVGKNAGIDLMNNNYTTGSKITITPPFFLNLEYYLIPFVIIVGICFIVMAMFMVTRYYKSYLEKRRNRITPANLKKIPTRKFKKGDDYYDVCAICLDEYKDGDKVRILPCDHVYHCKCVDPWLTEGKKTCPVCKRPVEAANETPARNTRQEASDLDVPVDENTPLIQTSTSPSTSGRSIEVV